MYPPISRVVVLLVMVLLVAVPAGAVEVPVSPRSSVAAAQPVEIGHLPVCVEAVPAAVGVPASGRNVNLDVRILMDGVGRRRAAQIVNRARASYEPVGITLRASYQAVSFRGSSVSGLLAQAKRFFGGARPRGIDVVHVLTRKNVEEGGIHGVAGGADCIGGVAFRNRAFAVSEVGRDTGGLLVGNHVSARLAAHELGHLLGGHHHYANCLEGIPSELGEGELSPCTLMFNTANLSSFNFSALNGLVVRGHAQRYAAP